MSRMTSNIVQTPAHYKTLTHLTASHYQLINPLFLLNIIYKMAISVRIVIHSAVGATHVRLPPLS